MGFPVSTIWVLPDGRPPTSKAIRKGKAQRFRGSLFEHVMQLYDMRRRGISPMAKDKDES
jgi:hypothetical protein